MCVVLHQFQWENRHTIKAQAEAYCLSIQKNAAINPGFDLFRVKRAYCEGILIWMHESPERDVITNGLPRLIKNLNRYSDEQIQQAITHARNHYQTFQVQVPASLDGSLMYYPDELDLVRMVTAVFSHSDWLHVLGNLLFFFAFAQGVEGLLDDKRKYVVIFFALLFITQISYFIYSTGSEVIVPTLGLSGVVMGMMGISAYLMPHARIKVFIWGYRYVNYYYIPAWILAALYIGWDALDLYLNGQNGGVNLVAHVSGGFAGFIIGLIFLRAHKRDIKEELAEETDYQVSRKKDFNSYDLSSTYGRERVIDRYHVRQSNKEYEAYMQEIYTKYSVHKDAEAILLLINDYSRYQQDFKFLEQVFNRILDWGKSRTLLCTGRLLIDILINANQYARAVTIVKQCQQVSSGFVLADPAVTSLLVKYAIEIHEYNVAYLLVHDAEQRYDSSVDVTPMKIREAELCILYLNKIEQGQSIIKHLLTDTDVAYKSEVIALAKLAR